MIVHGTTVTTNAVLTRRGATTGLLATKGFRDALALRNGLREAPYDNRLQPPCRSSRATCGSASSERIDYAGRGGRRRSTRTTSARPASASRAEGVEAVAISFMHSPAERRARAARARALPRAAARTPT